MARKNWAISAFFGICTILPMAVQAAPRPQAGTTTATSAAPSATLSFTPIVGANSTCTNRLKIQDLQSTLPDTFNLLVLALSKIQSTSDSDLLGYYQLSAIHGAPYTPWQMPSTGNYNRNTGYCTHHSGIFTSWHRPYVTLIEQVLFNTAQEIARTFSGSAQTRYLAAAALVRLPYWDWSDPVTQSRLPPIIKISTISVTRPDAGGSPVSATIANPFYSYNFNSASSVSSFSNPFNGVLRTLRSPSSSGVDQENVSDNAMQSGFATRRRATFNSFAQNRLYNPWSTAIENVHDGVHGSIGGGGHMSYVPFSAFDPIFWLHHCNIDRMMALYQAIQPGVYITSKTAVGTFARPITSSTMQDTVNTELYPFRHPDGSWWKSSDMTYASSVWSLNYGYPEVPCSYQTASSSQLDSFATTQINRLYGTTVTTTKRDAAATSLEWDANVVIDQSEIEGTFIVHLFLGTPDEDYTKWATSENEVGTLTNIGTPGLKKKSATRSAIVPLTALLEKRGKVGSVVEVTKYLEEQFTWRIVANGKPYEKQIAKTLKVAVMATEIIPAQSEDKLPVWLDPVYYFNVTSSKVGGAKKLKDIKTPVLVDGTESSETV